MPSVTRPAPPNRERRSSEQHEAAVEAVTEALERLLEQGESFTALGVQRIAGEAGLSRSTFYRHFPDKTAMLLEVTRTATAELFEIGGAWIDAFADREALDAALVGVVARRRSHRALISAIEELAAYDSGAAEFWRDLIDGNAERLAASIARGQREGLVAAGIDAKTTASFVLWGLERVLSVHMATRPVSEDVAKARRLSRTIWEALGRADA